MHLGRCQVCFATEAHEWSPNVREDTQLADAVPNFSAVAVIPNTCARLGCLDNAGTVDHKGVVVADLG